MTRSTTPSPTRAGAATVAVAMAMLVMLAGCAVTEPTTQLPFKPPSAWNEAAPGGEAPDTRWWQGFGSPQLDRLIDEAQLGSSDLAIAAERVRQAELVLRSTGADRLPAIGASADLGHNYRDESGISGSSSKSTAVRLSISYEVDLWGRLAAGQRGAEAALAASRYDLRAARLSLQASVASTWIALLGAREQVLIARENLAIAERVMKVVDARYRNGVASALDTVQQNSTVLAQRSALIPLELEVRQTQSALALLLGRLPQGFATRDERLLDLKVPSVAPGLPASLVARRPDLAAAEASLAAADADVAAARAALWPSLSLSAGMSLGTNTLLGLAHPAFATSIAASLAQSLFDGGRRDIAIDNVASQRRVLVETYAAAVRAAFKEVDDGLGNAERGTRQETAQREIIESARKALRLAELRYREGIGDLLAVLDAQRTLFNAQDLASQLRVARLNAAVDLFKALGGGWQYEPLGRLVAP